MKIFPNQLSQWKNTNSANSIVDIMTKRIYFMLITIWSMSIIIYYNSLAIVLSNHERKIQYGSAFQKTFMRGDISDRNGKLLCKTIQCYSCFINPRKLITKNTTKLAQDISKIIGQNEKLIYGKISNKKTPFVWIKRHIDNDTKNKLMAIGDPGINIVEDYSRKVVYKKITKHIVGTCDIDGNGISGLEKYFNDNLKQCKPISLTIDIDLQSIIHNILYEDMQLYNADGANAILMDINNGEILSMISVPCEDLNRNTSGVYEPGSTFKIINTAIALDSGIVDLHETFATNMPLKIAQYPIQDWMNKNYPLNTGEILVYSSNKGSVLIQRKVGKEIQKKYMESLGILQKCEIELPDVANPILPKFTNTDCESMSYGYAISISPISQISAMASILNGGYKIQPTLLKKCNTEHNNNAKRVISEKTSKTLAELMKLVVTHGTGSSANINSIGICGKTGTAQKILAKEYGKNSHITTFIGAFPYYKPLFIILVMYDNPKSNTNLTTAYYNAAKTAKKILQSIAPIVMHGEIVDESADSLKTLARKYMQNQ